MSGQPCLAIQHEGPEFLTTQTVSGQCCSAIQHDGTEFSTSQTVSSQCCSAIQHDGTEFSPPITNIYTKPQASYFRPKAM